MRRLLITAAGCALLSTAAWAQSPSSQAPESAGERSVVAQMGNPPSGRGDDFRGPRDDRGPDRDGWRRGRDEDWGWRAGPGGWRGEGAWRGGRWHGGMGSRAARFAFRSDQGSLAVRCAEEESMRACVDATMTLLDKMRSMRPTTPGQTQ